MTVRQVRPDPFPELFAKRPLGALIGGVELDDAGSEPIEVTNPADGTVLAAIIPSDRADIDRAVGAATAAFRSGKWPRTSPADRGRLLQSIARLITEHESELAEVECLDTGKPLSQARGDVRVAARYFEFFAGLADKITGDTIPLPPGEFAYSTAEPYGPIAHILPWNSPITQLARGVAPSLAAGNTVVIKPSSSAPLSTLLLGRLMTEAGVPAGVFNVVLGAGGTVGPMLAGHPGIRMVAFTGSVETGREILAHAAYNIVPCNLELGGKSPAVVFPGADLSAVVSAGVNALTRNAGQSCLALTRFIVHKSLFDEYVERICSAARELTVGPGIEDPNMGPLISDDQLTKVLARVKGGESEGAHVEIGGLRLTDGRLQAGYFMAPTILTSIKPSMAVAQEEIFGPVQCVLSFDSEDEAVDLANDSRYGLAAAVFGSDFGTIGRVVARLDAGQVQVNESPLGGVETPFGGYKQSGIGREKGVEAIRHYTQSKTVVARISPRPE